MCEVWHTSCIEAFAELQYDNDCAVAVHTGMASEACVGTCRDKLYTLVINCDGMVCTYKYSVHIYDSNINIGRKQVHLKGEMFVLKL